MTIFRKWMYWAVLISFVSACAGDPTEPVGPDVTKLYAELELNHKAIVISLHAPYDTVQLRASPKSMVGGVLPYTEDIQFHRINSLDTSVSVDSTGFVTARMATNSTKIEVRLTIDGITRTDTATIMVRGEFPVQPISRVEFFPLPPDSSWLWAGAGSTMFNGYTKWVRFFDAHGNRIPANQGVSIFRWNDEGLISLRAIEPARIGRMGETYIYTSMYAYGRAFVDSVLFRRVDPTVRFVVIARVTPKTGPVSVKFYPDVLRMKAGTTVFFVNANVANARIYPIQTCTQDACAFTYTKDFPSSRLRWIDSVDIKFQNPSNVLAGQSYGRFTFNTLQQAWPADGGSGNISAFGWIQCESIAGAEASDQCNGLWNGIGKEIDAGIRARKIMVPGNYSYSSTRFPSATGTIIVEE